MRLSIRITDDPPLHGFAIGEIVIDDFAGNRSSQTDGSRHCYMVLVELDTLLNQASSALINGSKTQHHLSSGGSITCDGKANSTAFDLPGFQAQMPLVDFVRELRELTRLFLQKLVDESEPTDPMIEQLRIGLEMTKDVS